MGDLSWWHWLIVVIAFVLLFGSKRLPDAARSLGRSMRIFKSELKTMHEEDEGPAPTTAPPTTAPPPQLPAATPADTTAPAPADTTAPAPADTTTPPVGEHTDAR